MGKAQADPSLTWWQRFRLIVKEMNYATHRMTEIQAPWISDDQKGSQMPPWMCKLIGHDKDYCVSCLAVWCFRCGKHITQAKVPCTLVNEEI